MNCGSQDPCGTSVGIMLLICLSLHYRKTTSLCLDLKCYIYLSLFSLQATHAGPAVMHGEKMQLSVAKV